MGKVLWHKNFVRDYCAQVPQWGFAAHPLLDGNRLVCLVGGKGSVAVAFDKEGAPSAALHPELGPLVPQPLQRRDAGYSLSG